MISFVLLDLALSIALSGTSNAQSTFYLTPSKPLFPKSFAECQTYEKEWERVRELVRDRHESCLKSAETKGQKCESDTSSGCSCSECSSFHNWGRLGGEEVRSCHADVRAHLDRVEKQRRDNEERNRKAEEREDQRKRNVHEQQAARADAARRAASEEQRARDAEAARSREREEKQTRETAAQRAAQADAARLELHEQQRSEAEAEQSEAARRRASEDQRQLDAQAQRAAAEEARTALQGANPFGPALTDGRGQQAPLVDPFRSSTGRSRPPDLQPAVTAAQAAIAGGRDLLRNNSRAAAQTLRGQALRDYRRSVDALDTILNGLDRVANVAQYGAAGASIASAEGRARYEAVADTARLIVQETGKKTITTVVTNIFGKQAGAALVGGPVGLAAAVGWEIFTPTRASRDHTEIIRDRTGTESLADKQCALALQWLAYESARRQPNSDPNGAVLAEIIENTHLVLTEAAAVRPR